MSSVFSLLEQLVSTGALSLVLVGRGVGVHLAGGAGVLVEVLSVDTLTNGCSSSMHHGALCPGPPPAPTLTSS